LARGSGDWGEKMAHAPVNMAQSGAQFTSFCRKLPMILCKKTGGLPVLNGLVFCVEFIVMRTANCAILFTITCDSLRSWQANTAYAGYVVKVSFYR
jgi:hypothetical protein